MDFSWPQATSLAFLYHWVWNFLVYRCLEKFYTAISSLIDLSNKFVDWKCFGDGLCLMDAFKLNYFIRFRLVQSNNRWHKLHGSIRKFFGRMDHNLTWLYFSENNVLMGSPTSSIGTLHGVLYCRTSTMTYSRTLFLVIVENKSGSKLSVHTITPQNDIGEWFTAFRLHSINHLFQTTHVILLWSEFSVTTTTLLFLFSLVTPLK